MIITIPLDYIIFFKLQKVNQNRLIMQIFLPFLHFLCKSNKNNWQMTDYFLITPLVLVLQIYCQSLIVLL